MTRRRFVVSDRQLAKQADWYRVNAPGACPGCHKPFERRSQKGPAPTRCPGCAKAHKALLDRKRPRRPAGAAKAAPLCCQEGRGTTCPQHQQARKESDDYERRRMSRKQVKAFFELFGEGMHVSR